MNPSCGQLLSMHEAQAAMWWISELQVLTISPKSLTCGIVIVVLILLSCKIFHYSKETGIFYCLLVPWESVSLTEVQWVMFFFCSLFRLEGSLAVTFSLKP